MAYSIVSQINPSIFRGYDIRGVADKDLNEDVYYTLGRAYASYLQERRIADCTVGHDNRLTSEAYTTAFIQGLNDGGVNAYDLGLSLSQIVYFSSYEMKTKGSVMITASHNPKEYNGYKAYWNDGAQVVPPGAHRQLTSRTAARRGAGLPHPPGGLPHRARPSR